MLTVGFKDISFYVYVCFHEFYDMFLISTIICDSMFVTFSVISVTYFIFNMCMDKSDK